MLQEYLEKLEEEMELPDKLPRESDVTWLMPIEEDRTMSMTQLSPGYYFFSPIGKPQADDREELYTTLMGANMYGAATDGGLIGMNEMTGELTFSMAIPKELSYDEFKNALEDFINMVTFWADKVQETAEAAEG